jgi:acyl-coenzyme A thioesterase PaaI-like protein
MLIAFVHRVAARARRDLRSLLERHLRLVLNWYPPYLGTGITVTELAPDYTTIRVTMPLTWYNRNYVGTQFGGSLYAMCDPFFMLMVIKQLGPAYLVWDKAATIRFLRPGRGAVHAVFRLAPEAVAALRAQADRDGKAEAVFAVEVTDDDGRSVARVDKVIHVRPKHPG